MSLILEVLAQAAPVSSATDKIAQYGVLGPILILLGYAYWQERTAHLNAKDAQTKSSEAHADKLIALNDRMKDAIQANVGALDANTAATEALEGRVGTVDEKLNEVLVSVRALAEKRR